LSFVWLNILNSTTSLSRLRRRCDIRKWRMQERQLFRNDARNKDSCSERTVESQRMTHFDFPSQGRIQVSDAIGVKSYENWVLIWLQSTAPWDVKVWEPCFNQPRLQCLWLQSISCPFDAPLQGCSQRIFAGSWFWPWNLPSILTKFDGSSKLVTFSSQFQAKGVHPPRICPWQACQASSHWQEIIYLKDLTSWLPQTRVSKFGIMIGSSWCCILIWFHMI